MNKKVMVAAGVTAAFTIMTAGITYARLNTKTPVIVNDFAGACVNIGVAEKNSDEEVNIYEDKGSSKDAPYDENGDYNTNASYEKISESDRTREKEFAVKNITSEEYPTTDTYVRVRLVPMLVYDDNEKNIDKGVVGQIVPVDMKGNVKYTFASDITELSEDSFIGADDEEEGSWMYKEGTSFDENDRYYYYTKPIAPDETTPILLKEVTYEGELPEGTHFELKVLAEGIAAVQVANIN